jgi:hypothetical protein
MSRHDDVAASTLSERDVILAHVSEERDRQDAYTIVFGLILVTR